MLFIIASMLLRPLCIFEITVVLWYTSFSVYMYVELFHNFWYLLFELLDLFLWSVSGLLSMGVTLRVRPTLSAFRIDPPAP